MKPRRARPADPSDLPGLVLDAGALRALEHYDVVLAAALRTARRLDMPIRIPAAALAQVWRGGPRSAQLARLLSQSATVVSVDEVTARQIGEFIARSHLPDGARADVVDAHVALTTRLTQSVVYTSDPRDMARYGVGPDQIRKI